MNASLGTEILCYFEPHSRNPMFRKFVARNPRSSADTLERLSDDIYDDVRYEAEHSVSTPATVAQREREREPHGMLRLLAAPKISRAGVGCKR